MDDVAAGIREQWGYGHIRSYRLALEKGQPEVCDQINAILGTHDGDPGYFGHQTLSKLERWPTCPRRPTVGQLHALAQVFGTTPRKLVADVDWDKLPPADQLAVDALDTAPSGGATGSTGAVGMMEPTRPPAGRTSLVPPTPWGTPDGTRSGNPTERDVLMSGEESARYAGHGGNIDDLTLEQLRDGVAEQAAGFANVPRLELFGGVRLLRDRIFAYLDGGQPMRQRRDLYFMAGAACGMLAAVSDDLGYATAAMSHARAGHVFALEAGDPALTGWLYAVQSLISYWNSQPGRAREYARRGAAANPAGSVGVWLPALEARASGDLGDAEGTRRAVTRAAEVRELVQPCPLDDFGGLMAFNQAKQHFYASGAYLGIGDDPAVITEAETAVHAYQRAPLEEQAHDNIAMVRFQSAIAHIRAGDLDAAGETARSALQVAPEHRNTHVDKSARRLHQHLCTEPVRTSPLAVDTRDQIEDFLSSPTTHPELS
ncbi:MAG TPA: hypothetical protein VFX70_06510 [Mycobacteriales bacterium]|nr:hypothetical protein [Mycobacteriales bacterium]